MSRTNTGENRQQRITFCRPIAADDRQAQCAELLAIDGVLAARFDDAELLVEYSFPDTTFHELWQLILAGVPGGQIGRSARWRSAIAAFREENERAHLCSEYHWDTYVRDVHVYYADLEAHERAAGHKHLWRRHQKKTRPGSRAASQ